MITRNFDNVSSLVQSCKSGLTAFEKRTASPSCCIVRLKHLLNNIHVITAVNNGWISLLRFGSSRYIFNEI